MARQASSLVTLFLGSLSLGVMLALGGCTPKAGDSCTAGAQACMNPTTGLFCGADGKYAVMSCNGDGKGPGCSGSGESFACDNSISAVGDGCSQVGDVACTADHKSALECTKDNKFIIGETCKGTGGCTIKDTSITCDNDTSDLGDPCHFLGDYACTSDKGLVLRCDDHKMTPLNTCRGPKQCRVFELPQEKKVQFACDDSLAMEGDPCDTLGEQACSLDKKSIFTCKGNKFTAKQPCSGPNGCTYEEKGDTYTCDNGAAAPAASSSAAAPIPTTAVAAAKPPPPPAPKKK
jgi:hypothetical protein